MQHLGEPIKRGIRIRTANRFDECRSRVVMRVAIRIVNHGLALNGFFSNPKRDPNHTILIGRRGHHRQLKRGQRLARIAIGFLRKVIQSFSTCLDQFPTKPAILIRQGSLQQSHDLIHRHRLKLENLRARNQRRIDMEIRVVRRRTNEPHHPALDVRQEHILLRFVETMNFINEQNRRLSPQLTPGAGLINPRADFSDIRLNAIERFKSRTSRTRDHTGQRCLSRAGRTVKNQRGETIRFDCAPQQFPLAQNVTLPCHLIQGPRPHARGKRLWSITLAGGRGGSGEKIGHGRHPQHPTRSRLCQPIKSGINLKPDPSPAPWPTTRGIPR